MPSVKCFTIEGLQCIVHTRDHHPPHFHVIRTGEWEIKVGILTTTERELDYEIVWPNKLKKIQASYSNRLIKVVTENRTRLLDEWQTAITRSLGQKKL
jgi:hypothetical protein